MSPVTATGLSSSGICNKISTPVIYASSKYPGLGIKHPYVTQGIRKIDLLLNIIQQITNNLIDTSWQRTMAESKCGYNFLEHNYKKFQQLVTDGWITSLWAFVTE
jgi:hypothetical protein